MPLDYWLYNQYNMVKYVKRSRKMEQMKKDFCIPYYIFDEIVEYIELTAKGYSKSMKWENIKSLLRLAVVSNSMADEQAKYIEKTFCREK